MSFLPGISDTAGFGWIRKHPVAATLAAAAAAAVSLAQFAYNEQLSERNRLIGRLSSGSAEEQDEFDGSTDIDRSVSWSDERGGKLETIVDDGYSSYISSPHIAEGKFEGLEDCILRDGSPQRQSDEEDNESDSDVPVGAKSPVSPQWGWYVSITPPKSSVYPNPEHNNISMQTGGCVTDNRVEHNNPDEFYQ